MKETLKNILYTGIGIAFLTKEKVEELKAELIDAQVEQLMNLAEKFEVEYDGWGTYFEDPNGEDGDDEEDEDIVDEDDDGVRH